MTSARTLLRRLRLLVSIAVLASTGAATATEPTFSTKRTINAFINGLLPFDVRTADVDQDGDLDIYTANYSGRIAWFENDGGHPPGPWVEHVLTEFADGAEAVVAARVDADADIDFLSAAFNLDEIAWYENGGNGQVWTARPITFSARLAVDVWAADLDADGDNDAISVSGFDGAVAWYENTGFNSWTIHTIPAASANSVEAADLDQDGDLDIAAGSVWYDSDGGAPPAFTPRPISTAPAFADAVAVLDVDRDGDPDVLTAGQEDDRIVWYENDGGSPPSWTERAISTSAIGARSVFAADLEGDGDMDILSASQSDAKVVWHVNEADYPDADRDGMRDGIDCAPGNGTAFLVPREVSGVRFRSGTALEWNSAAAGSGSGARHEVVRGALSQLPPGSGSAETCLANNLTARSLIEETIPAPGTGFYYLVRASNACGTGTLGAGTSGAPRSTAACP